MLTRKKETKHLSGLNFRANFFFSSLTFSGQSRNIKKSLVWFGFIEWLAMKGDVLEHFLQQHDFSYLSSNFGGSIHFID